MSFLAYTIYVLTFDKWKFNILSLFLSTGVSIEIMHADVDYVLCRDVRFCLSVARL